MLTNNPEARFEAAQFNQKLLDLHQTFNDRKEEFDRGMAVQTLSTVGGMESGSFSLKVVALD